MDDFLPAAETLLRDLQRQPRERRQRPRQADGGVGGRRQQERLPVSEVRPLQFRWLPLEASEVEGWQSANILDISLGGMALLVCAPPGREPGARLQLDLSNHPHFGAPERSAVLRWSRLGGLFAVLGVAFDEPLSALPELTPEPQLR